MQHTGCLCHTSGCHECKIWKPTLFLEVILYVWFFTNAPNIWTHCYQVRRYSNILVTADADVVQNHLFITASSKIFKSGTVCKHMPFYRFMSVCTLVGSNSLVDPVAQVGHSCIHGRGTHVAVRGAPGDNTNKIPHPTVLTDQRATWVTLKWHKYGFRINF